MKIYDSIIIFLWVVISLSCSTKSRKSSDTIRKYLRRTGEYVAVEDLIQKYEREHQQFFVQQFKDGNGIQWLDLDNKNLSKYCGEYLQHNMPGRKSEGVIGVKMEEILHYEKENIRLTTAVVILKCRVNRMSDNSSYYITRAPETNCVYTLKCTKYSKNHQGHFVFTIINKYCDFEGTPLKNNSLKDKEVVKNINQATGQPVAKDKYLLQYEMEHCEWHKKEAIGIKQIKWHHAMLCSNLDSFCNQYIRSCAPGRNAEGVTGSWNTQLLHYQKLETKKDIVMSIVTCLVPGVNKRYYHMTRAKESRCVYALLRKGRNAPFVIIFKHCDFQYPKDQTNISKCCEIIDKNLIPKTEVKEEVYDSLKTVQFFPND